MTTSSSISSNESVQNSVMRCRDFCVFFRGWRKGRGGCVQNIGNEVQHEFRRAQKTENTDPCTNYAVKHATARGHFYLPATFLQELGWSPHTRVNYCVVVFLAWQGGELAARESFSWLIGLVAHMPERRESGRIASASHQAQVLRSSCADSVCIARPASDYFLNQLTSWEIASPICQCPS